MPKAQNKDFVPKNISHEELKKHRTLNDAWVSMGGKVYDISGWGGHPGGSVIYTHAGEDMTDAFNLFHAPSARKYLDEFYIGEIIEGSEIPLTTEEKVIKEKQRKFEMAYRDLRGKMISAGLFKLNKGYYLYKFISQLLLVGGAAYAASIPGNIGFYAGAVLLGLFWQQSGWLCHDFCHNQLCELKEGRALSYWNHGIGLVTGNLWQGFSVKWWKDKHNRHHAVPNVHGGEDNTMNADPDIDTMPLLAWSRKMAALGKDSPVGRFMISIQKFTYMPLLCIARFSWLLQSIQFAWCIKGNGVFEGASKSEDLEKATENYLVGPAKTFEQAFLVLHHIWVFLLCYQRPSVLEALSFWMLSQVVCGFLLFSVTSLGHNGLPVYEADERPDYWKLQVTTTRNITGNAFVHWLCGGLEYQVDHHLFPMMPRHSLPAAHEIIVQFCKEHDLKFNEENYFRGTVDILKHLDVVAQDFLQDFPAI